MRTGTAIMEFALASTGGDLNMQAAYEPWNNDLLKTMIGRWPVLKRPLRQARFLSLRFLLGLQFGNPADPPRPCRKLSLQTNACY